MLSIGGLNRSERITGTAGRGVLARFVELCSQPSQKCVRLQPGSSPGFLYALMILEFPRTLHLLGYGHPLDKVKLLPHANHAKQLR
jgi:hypothetical protein